MNKKLILTATITLLAIGGYVTTNSQPITAKADNLSASYNVPLNQFNQKIWAQKMVDELNRLRTQNGLNPVVADSSLMTFSQGRADTIAQKRTLDHSGNYNEVMNPSTWATEILENIDYTSGRNTDAKNAIAWFYDDSGNPDFGHRKSMLAPFATKVGVGVTYVKGSSPSDGQLWIAMTIDSDKSMSSDPLHPNDVDEYEKYCQTEGIDNVKYPSHYDIANKEYWAVYNEQGVSWQNIEDAKFGPNTKTPSNPSGTESGAPVTSAKPAESTTPSKPAKPTQPSTPADDGGQVIADNGSTADIVHNDESSSTTTNPAGSTIATHQVMPGVVTVNRTISHLYDKEGKLIVDRALIKGSSWLTSMQIMINGTVYYQVSTNEFIKADEVNYYPKGLNNYARISAKQILIDNIPNNVVKLTAGTKLWNLAPDGKSMNIEVDRYLAPNSRWLTDKSLYIGGVTFYRVSSNEWVPAGFGYLEK